MTKAKQLDVGRIAKANPAVDVEQLREVQALVSKLRRDGLPKPTYDLLSPYEGRRP